MFDDGTVAARRAPVRRTPADRALIVAETYEPGATVAGVARRHGIVASQLSSWRTAAKRRAPLDNTSSQSFAAITVVPDGCPQSFDGIEVVVGTLSVRLPKNTMPKRIADIAQRLAYPS